MGAADPLDSCRRIEGSALKCRKPDHATYFSQESPPADVKHWVAVNNGCIQLRSNARAQRRAEQSEAGPSAARCQAT